VWGISSPGDFFLSLISQKYIKVVYPSTSPLLLYQRIKRIGGGIINFFRNAQITRFINRVISVAKPSGKVYIVPKPNHQIVDANVQGITIMSANLWHDWPRKRRLDSRLRCLVDIVEKEKVDVLLLQELSRTSDFHVDQWLSDRLGMAYIYSRTNGNASEIDFEEGLAIFSRFPIKNHRLAQLSDQANPFSRRMALGTSVESSLGEFDVYSVHLGLSGRQNKKQFFRLREWVDRNSKLTPAVIGGDFNAGENSPQVRETSEFWKDSFRYKNPDRTEFSHELRWPWGGVINRSRLDYLFMRQGKNSWKIEEAWHVNIENCPLSDHRPVIVRASLN
jgi:endonuclease/exonuclease/phosphatase family metal-dependent hydrolase